MFRRQGNTNAISKSQTNNFGIGELQVKRQSNLVWKILFEKIWSFFNSIRKNDDKCGRELDLSERGVSYRYLTKRRIHCYFITNAVWIFSIIYVHSSNLSLQFHYIYYTLLDFYDLLINLRRTFYSRLQRLPIEVYFRFLLGHRI